MGMSLAAKQAAGLSSSPSSSSAGRRMSLSTSTSTSSASRFVVQRLNSTEVGMPRRRSSVTHGQSSASQSEFHAASYSHMMNNEYQHSADVSKAPSGGCAVAGASVAAAAANASANANATGAKFSRSSTFKEVSTG